MQDIANNLKVGSRIKEVRKKLGYSQGELGALLGGYKHASVYGWEKLGQPVSQKALAKLENMGVSLKYLLEGLGEPFTKNIPKKASTKISKSKALGYLKVAELIKCYREKFFFGHGGQQSFAEKVGISRQLLSSWEVGRTTPSDENIKKLAKAFGVGAKQLKEEIDEALNSVNNSDEETKTHQEAVAGSDLQAEKQDDSNLFLNNESEIEKLKQEIENLEIDKKTLKVFASITTSYYRCKAVVEKKELLKNTKNKDLIHKKLEYLSYFFEEVMNSSEEIIATEIQLEKTDIDNIAI